MVYYDKISIQINSCWKNIFKSFSITTRNIKTKPTPKNIYFKTNIILKINMLYFTLKREFVIKNVIINRLIVYFLTGGQSLFLGLQEFTVDYKSIAQ